jgi:hypothetical protein
MKPSSEEEYQRFMGFPDYLWPWAAHRPEGPRSAGRSKSRGVLHPIAWFRWRLDLKRRGPYAPSFGDFLGQHQSEGP